MACRSQTIEQSNDEYPTDDKTENSINLAGRRSSPSTPPVPPPTEVDKKVVHVCTWHFVGARPPLMKCSCQASAPPPLELPSSRARNAEVVKQMERHFGTPEACPEADKMTQPTTR